MKERLKSVLNLGSGKIDINDFPGYDFVVHLDRSYINGLYSPISTVELLHSKWMVGESIDYNVNFCANGLFEFLDTYKFKFNHINADRIFEHQSFSSGEVGRLLDACNQITYDDATMSIIVPNAKRISELILQFEEQYDNMSSEKLNSMALLINTENHNEKCDCHASSWTPKLAKHYIAIEGGTWKIDKIEDPISHKGRDIYMKLLLSK